MSIILLLAAHIQPSRAILSTTEQLSGAIDPFLDRLENDDDVITNGSRFYFARSHETAVSQAVPLSVPTSL